ncbi:MAG: TfoX/Sxy family protein [Candidatus Lindowbacteria bacterium]|nr:TfoX/Sxy family protein [Candidatus Lindowbacteria bacterium]
MNDAFISYLLEMLQEFGRFEAKAMFGGYGVYRDDLMFALVTDDTLYIKVDDETRSLFEEKELPRFSYRKKGKVQTMSYYQAPEEAIDNADALEYWASLGYQAALRAKGNSTKS